MAKSREWMDRLAGQLEAQTLPGLPLVEIAGQNRVLIENHRGVCAYGAELINVRVSYGEVSVRGCALELAKMSREQLVITGKIDCVALIRRQG